MGDYTAGMEKEKYPSIVALQATEREITLKLHEYKQAVGEYLTLVGADATPDDARCPLSHPFPFYGAAGPADSPDSTLAGPATACCASGDIKTSGRWPRRHANVSGNGPSNRPEKHVGFDIAPGKSDIYNEPRG